MRIHPPLLALLLLLPAVAPAADENRFYGQLSVGYAALDGVELHTDGGPRVDVDADHGQTLQLAVGYRSTVKRGRIQAVRFELQHAFASNDVESISSGALTGGAEVEDDGRITTNALMLNMLFEAHPVGVMTPVFGAGLGWSYFHLDDVAGIDDGDFAPAAQVMLGLAADLSDRFQLGFFYRARRQQDVRLQDDSGDFVDVETGTAHALTGAATFRF